MRTIFMTICLLLTSTLIQWAPTAEAQVNPDITLTCSPSGINIDVAPGDTRIGTTYCDATNPTQYEEKVRIQITSAGLTYSAPGSITVGAGETNTFEVVVRGEDQMAEGTRQVTISALVTEANGVQCTDCTAVTYDVMVFIKQHSLLRVESSGGGYQTMMPGESMTLNFTVHNEGNGLDIFHIRVGNIEELENAGFFVSLSENELLLERNSYGAVGVTIVAPSIRDDDWVTTDSEGNDVPFTLVLTATSNHSIRGSLDVGLAMSQSLQMAINVEGLTDVAPACKKSGVDLVGPTILSLGIVSLLCAALYVRKT